VANFRESPGFFSEVEESKLVVRGKPKGTMAKKQGGQHYYMGKYLEEKVRSTRSPNWAAGGVRGDRFEQELGQARKRGVEAARRV